MSGTESDLPDLAAILGGVLQRVPAPDRALLVALAERLAAARYREWARSATDPARRSGLLACAEREDEIARRAEACHPAGSSVAQQLRASHPDLPELYAALFAGRSLEQQFAVQARGERLGAATWRAFAASERDPETCATFLGCALLEEENAAFLESLLP